MANSDVFVAKENPDEDVSIKPALHFQKHQSHESVPKCSKPISRLNQSCFTRRNSCQSQNGKKKEEGGGYEAAGPLSLSLSKENHCNPNVEEQEEKEEEEDEDEDGFRTPTCLDQRIPEVKECPPAPIKAKPTSLKRKAPQNKHTCTALHLSSQELQQLFPVLHNPLFHSHRITKKFRRHDSN